MGNTLCKPVINPPIQNVEQSKDIEPLLTEEAIKILVVNEPISEATVSEATVSEAPVIKEEESRVDTLVNEEKLSVVLPPDDLKEDELVTPMKKKRGRKKKGEQ